MHAAIFLAWSKFKGAPINPLKPVKLNWSDKKPYKCIGSNDVKRLLGLKEILITGTGLLGSHELL